MLTTSEASDGVVELVFDPTQRYRLDFSTGELSRALYSRPDNWHPAGSYPVESDTVNAEHFWLPLTVSAPGGDRTGIEVHWFRPNQEDPFEVQVFDTSSGQAWGLDTTEMKWMEIVRGQSDELTDTDLTPESDPAEYFPGWEYIPGGIRKVTDGPSWRHPNGNILTESEVGELMHLNQIIENGRTVEYQYEIICRLSEVTGGQKAFFDEGAGYWQIGPRGIVCGVGIGDGTFAEYILQPNGDFEPASG
ncbi:hypothetical protein A2Z33_00420 [Candidatus Gottesmanbacteria bacterium RBG_16_52_11]|uniref:Uncharacterized protein n=1 Tax=Candidatus Gottesmanbacteria bacterium RBG_16_52_11 TaxID=1798374 RepID=A0A1F5YN07_9BACT|nr:MAG: hypothetical protein A2Z33_00420 [Candidatus Gottesmanbacteria bacterium RBG_16_52_11]